MLVSIIRHVIHPLGMKLSMWMRSYLLALVGKSYIKKMRIIIDISHFRVSFFLNPSVTVVHYTTNADYVTTKETTK